MERRKFNNFCEQVVEFVKSAPAAGFTRSRRTTGTIDSDEEEEDMEAMFECSQIIS